jgi:hypothetical protein
LSVGEFGAKELPRYYSIVFNAFSLHMVMDDAIERNITQGKEKPRDNITQGN